MPAARPPLGSNGTFLASNARTAPFSPGGRRAAPADDQGHVEQAGGPLGMHPVPLVVGGPTRVHDHEHLGQPAGLPGLRYVPLAADHADAPSLADTARFVTRYRVDAPHPDRATCQACRSEPSSPPS